MAFGAGSVATGALALQSFDGVHAAAPESDVVDQALRRELREAVNGLRGTRRRGESARRLAATLRLTAAHYEARNYDAAFARHLQARVRREGRETLLRLEPNPRMLAAELKEYGFTTPPPAAPFDYAARTKALDGMLARGLTPMLRDAAAALESVSAGLDDQPSLTLARAQGYGCPDLSYKLRVFEIAIAAVCFWNPVACAAISGAYAGLLIGLMIMGCPI